MRESLIEKRRLATPDELKRVHDDKILTDIQNLSKSGLVRLRRLLGVSEPVRSVGPELSNEDVRAHVLVYGHVSHEPGFVPAMPEPIVMMGPEAVRIARDRWLHDGVHPTQEMLQSDEEYLGMGKADQKLLAELGPDYERAADAEGLAELARLSGIGDAGEESGLSSASVTAKEE